MYQSCICSNKLILLGIFKFFLPFLLLCFFCLLLSHLLIYVGHSNEFGLFLIVNSSVQLVYLNLVGLPVKIILTSALDYPEICFQVETSVFLNVVSCVIFFFFLFQFSVISGNELFEVVFLLDLTGFGFCSQLEFSPDLQGTNIFQLVFWFLLFCLKV